MEEKLTLKDILKTLSYLVTALVIILLVWFKPAHKDEVTDVPDSPPEIDINEELPNGTEVTLGKKKILPVISQGTTFEKDSLEQFTQWASKIAINGEIEKADIVLEIKPIIKEKNYMLSVTLDNTSGIFRAFREKLNRINLTKTEDLNGIFSSKSLKIPLTDEILMATTNEEFIETQASNKKVILWNSILVKAPITVFRLLAIPMNAKTGSLTDFSVEKMEIEYTCKNDSDCSLLLCKQEEKYYDCIKSNFGVEEANKWYEIFKKK